MKSKKDILDDLEIELVNFMKITKNEFGEKYSNVSDSTYFQLFLINKIADLQIEINEINENLNKENKCKKK